MKEFRGTHYHTVCEAKITSEIARLFANVITDTDMRKMSKIVTEALYDFRKDVVKTERYNIWYSVKDNVPELNVPVIFRRSDGFVFRGVLKSLDFQKFLEESNWGEKYNITHFMYNKIMGEKNV